MGMIPTFIPTFTKSWNSSITVMPPASNAPYRFFAMVRMWGGGVLLSYWIQGVVSAASIAATCWLARHAAANVRNAAAMAAAMLSTPYVLDYDFVVLGVGCAFLAAEGIKRGFLDYDKSLLALIWVAPMFARSAGTFLLVPLGQAAALARLILALRRAYTLGPVAFGGDDGRRPIAR